MLQDISQDVKLGKFEPSCKYEFLHFKRVIINRYIYISMITDWFCGGGGGGVSWKSRMAQQFNELNQRFTITADECKEEQSRAAATFADRDAAARKEFGQKAQTTR